MLLDASILVLLVVPAAILVVEIGHVAPKGLWITMALGNVLIAVAFAVYYAKGKFLDKHV